MYVITATLNGLDYTKRLLAALAQVQGVPLRVVVVDNGSTDGTPAWIEAECRNGGGLILIANERNTGVSAAWNIGIRTALLNGADQILVCGNDTVPQPGTVERLSDLLKQGIPFVTGTAVPYDKPDVLIPLALPHEPLLAAPDFSCFAFVPQVVEAVAQWDAMVEFNVLAQLKAQTPEGQPIQRPPLLMKPWDFGLADERFWPAYGEDNDYHLRLQRAGLIALRDPGAEFRHETSLTIRINHDVGEQNKQTFVRNLELFRAKWGGLPHEVEAIPGSNLYPIGARPLNVTDEQWQRMTAGHPVLEIDRQVAIEQARRTYSSYGITA